MRPALFSLQSRSYCVAEAPSDGVITVLRSRLSKCGHMHDSLLSHESDFTPDTFSSLVTALKETKKELENVRLVCCDCLWLQFELSG